MTHITRTATIERYELAEGVLWDGRAGLVRWVDIPTGRILSGRLLDDRITGITSQTLQAPIGAIALAEDGGILVAAARSLATVSPTGAVSYGPDLLGARTEVRFNDGTVDPQGRFVVGTLALAAETGREVLLRVSPDGGTETLRTGIRLSNGIAFSPTGTTIYHVDTLARTVSSHPYRAGAFDSTIPWTVVIEDLDALPDGLTVDQDGMLWVALWGGSSVRRYTPAGELLTTVRVDATRASCPSFVGRNLSTLAITSAAGGAPVQHDDDGALFVASVDVTGILPHRWRGSTTTPYWTPRASGAS